jgi:hypothetical protein
MQTNSSLTLTDPMTGSHLTDNYTFQYSYNYVDTSGAAASNTTWAPIPYGSYVLVAAYPDSGITYTTGAATVTIPGTSTNYTTTVVDTSDTVNGNLASPVGASSPVLMEPLNSNDTSSGTTLTFILPTTPGAVTYDNENFGIIPAITVEKHATYNTIPDDAMSGSPPAPVVQDPAVPYQATSSSPVITDGSADTTVTGAGLSTTPVPINLNVPVTYTITIKNPTPYAVTPDTPVTLTDILPLMMEVTSGPTVSDTTDWSGSVTPSDYSTINPTTTNQVVTWTSATIAAGTTTFNVSAEATQTDGSPTTYKNFATLKFDGQTLTTFPTYHICQTVTFYLKKTLTSTSATAQQFEFQFDYWPTAADEAAAPTKPYYTFYDVLTVPAGSLNATDTFVNQQQGYYQVQELQNNWRYTPDTPYGSTIDKTITQSDSSATNPSFAFTNTLTDNKYISNNASVNNQMASPTP